MPKVVIRVTAVELTGPHPLALRFNDGASRRVDLPPELKGPIFELLRDPAYFSRVALDPVAGTVVWPNGAGFAPEFLRALPQERVARPSKKLPNFAVQWPNRFAARRRPRALGPAAEPVGAWEQYICRPTEGVCIV